jgi:hypothetical protein
MSWLPLTAPAASESEAVLALQPEPAERLREALALSWRITDPDLLQQCRLRMADVLGCPAVPRSSGGPESAATAYAEQFAVDQKGITAEQKADLALERSPHELVDFVQALNLHDGWLRVLTVLGVAPPDDVGEPTGEPLLESGDDRDAPTAGGGRWAALTEPSFFGARRAFGASTALLAGVDDLTTECCRLFNASYQACAY